MKAAIEKEYTDIHILVVKNLLKDFWDHVVQKSWKSIFLVPSNDVSWDLISTGIYVFVPLSSHMYIQAQAD